MNESDQFYENLLMNTTESTRLLSLKRLKDACDFFCNNKKSKAFTLADIGRYCETTWGGPKTQSIRNSTDVLERYVKLRIAEHSTSLSLSPSEMASANNSLNLANPAIAHQQYMLALAEVEQLRQEVSRLKVDIKRYTPLTTDQLLAAAGRDSVVSIILESSGGLPLAALEAIRTLLDPARLSQCEMVIDHHNYLVHEISRNELLSANQVASLQALIN